MEVKMVGASFLHLYIIVAARRLSRLGGGQGWAFFSPSMLIQLGISTHVRPWEHTTGAEGRCESRGR